MRLFMVVLLAMTLFPVAASALPSTVKSVLSKIKRNCSGYQLISTYRRGARIAGTRTRSLHSYGLAADFRVRNYSCALRILSRTPNIGYSRDGARCGHIHVSDGRRVGRREPRGFRHGRC